MNLEGKGQGSGGKEGASGVKGQEFRDGGGNSAIQMKSNCPSVGKSSCEEDKEEDTVQTKPIAERITPLVQRQPEEEQKPDEEEEVVQGKSLDSPFVQHQEENKEEEQKKEPEEEPLQMQRQSAEAIQPQPGLSSRLQSLQGGEPLSTATRAFFEHRFGSDFSHVRVHRDSGAAERRNRSKPRLSPGDVISCSVRAGTSRRRLRGNVSWRMS